jgi:SLOG in TRPM, prokaryote
MICNPAGSGSAPPPAVVRVAEVGELRAALAALGVGSPRPVLVSVGGASGMSPEHLAVIGGLIRDHVLPVLERHGVAVVDGGTDSGVMRLFGQARAVTGARFPLIGVAAIGTVALPGEPAGHDSAALEPRHTGVVLVPGDSWGAESPWLADVAARLADGKPSLTLVIDGGSITYDDVENSLARQRPVLVLAGSGRAADAIAGAAAGNGGAGDARARRIAGSPLTRLATLGDGAAVAAVLGEMLGVGAAD